MAGLKRTEACATCIVKDAEILTLKMKMMECKRLLDQLKDKKVQESSSSSEEISEDSGQRKRRRMITSSESSKDESEEEFSSSPRPVVTQNRLKTVKEKAPSTREEKQRAKAAEQEAKEVRKAVQAFKLQAGPKMKEAMAWKKRCRPFNFSLDISETVFRALVSCVDIETSTCRSYYNKGAKLLTAELDQEDVVEVFGVGRSQQKYRLGDCGVITSMTLEYSSGSVHVHGKWSLK